MEKVLESGNLGTIGTQSIVINESGISAKANISADGVSVGVNIDVNGKMIIEAIAAKIGGPLPEMVAQFIETSLGWK